MHLKLVSNLQLLHQFQNLEHLRKGDCTAETGVIFIALVGVLRQVTDRLDNIAARTALLLNFDIGLKKNR